MVFLNSLRKVLPALFGSGPSADRLRLRVEPELAFLSSVSSVTETINEPVLAPGVVSRISPPHQISEANLLKRLEGRIGGAERPAWADGTGGAGEFGVCLCRLTDALYTPEFGAVITPDGAALHSSVAEALYFTKNLSAFPGVKMADEVAMMSLPAVDEEL